MNFWIFIIILGISFVTSLTAFFQRDTRGYLRLFPFFLLLTMSMETFAFTNLQTRGMRKIIVILYNFFTSFEFLFYMYVLREIIQNTRAKKVVFHISWLFLLLVILNFLFVQKITSSTSITYGLGCLLIVAICIYYFYELFQLSHSVNLVRQPAFWICSGLLFFYCCSFPIYGLIIFLYGAPPIVQKNFGVILFLLNVFLYSSFTIAFLCRLRTRKSTS